VLLIQDTTELDYTAHPGCQGLGRFGKGERWTSGLGMLLHGVLAIEPLEDGPSRVLGLAWNKLWARSQPVRAKRQTAKQRRAHGCESDRWVEAVDAIGAAPRRAAPRRRAVASCTWATASRTSSSCSNRVAASRTPRF